MSSSHTWAYKTPLGTMFHGDALDVMAEMPDACIDLIVTSPPFALARPKAYGNETESKYVDWFMQFAWEFHRILKDDGSLVIDLGGAWVPGSPTKSLYQWRLLIELVDTVHFHLAQDFYWFNRAKLPGPANWVTVNRVRAKDAVNTLWWLSKSTEPKANNRNVLVPYSKSMQRLLKRGTYNDGTRPGGQYVGKNWAKDQGGAISPNVIETGDDERQTWGDLRTDAYAELFAEMMGETESMQDLDNMLDQGNTNSSDPYHAFCRANELKRHPARFPWQVPEFFVKFLSAPDDLVFDPFGGSNVTGAVAESLGRRWLTTDLDMDYIAGSIGRFADVEVVTPD